MTSLFGGLFDRAGRNAEDSLFSESNHYKSRTRKAHACEIQSGMLSAHSTRAAAEPAAVNQAAGKETAKKPRKINIERHSSAADAKQNLKAQARAAEAAAKAAANQQGDAERHLEADGGKLKNGRQRQGRQRKKKLAVGQTSTDTPTRPSSHQEAAGVSGRDQSAAKKKRKSKPAHTSSPAGSPADHEPLDPASTEEAEPPGCPEGAAQAAGGGAAAKEKPPKPGKLRRSQDKGQQDGKEGDAGLLPATREEREAAEQAKLARTVFVGNLAATVQRKALKKLFRRYGAVESVRVRSLPVVPDAKLPRKAAAITGAVQRGRASAHAYIVFEEPQAAEAALGHNMQEFEGLHLRVDRAASNSKGGKEAAGVQYDPSRTLFLGNLHLEIGRAHV